MMAYIAALILWNLKQTARLNKRTGVPTGIYTGGHPLSLLYVAKENTAKFQYLLLGSFAYSIL